MFTSNQGSNPAGNFGGAADWLWKNKHRYETLFETHVSKKNRGNFTRNWPTLFGSGMFTTIFIMTSPTPVDFTPFIPASEVIERSRMVFTENSVGFCCIRAVKCSAALKAMNFGRWTSNEQRFTGTSRIWFPYSSQNLAVNVIHRSNFVCV